MLPPVLEENHWVPPLEVGAAVVAGKCEPYEAASVTE